MKHHKNNNNNNKTKSKKSKKSKSSNVQQLPLKKSKNNFIIEYVQAIFQTILFPFQWVFQKSVALFQYFNSFHFRIEINVNVYRDLNEMDSFNSELKKQGNIKIIRNLKFVFKFF